MDACFSLVFLLAVLGVKVLRQLDAGKFHFTDGTGLVEDAEIDLVEYRTDIAVLHIQCGDGAEPFHVCPSGYLSGDLPVVGEGFPGVVP